MPCTGPCAGRTKVSPWVEGNHHPMHCGACGSFYVIRETNPTTYRSTRRSDKRAPVLRRAPIYTPHECATIAAAVIDHVERQGGWSYLDKPGEQG